MIARPKLPSIALNVLGAHLTEEKKSIESPIQGNSPVVVQFIGEIQ